MTRGKRTTESLDIEVLQSIHDAHENQWNNLVIQSERGTLFHRYEWLAAVESSGAGEPRHAVVRSGGHPVAIMPNFLKPLELPNEWADMVADRLNLSVLTSTHPGYGGPLTSTSEQQALDRLLDAVAMVDDRWVLYHLIQTYDAEYIRYGAPLEARGYESTVDACTFSIELETGWEHLYESMDKERRRSIRHAQDQDFEIRVERLSECMDRTYEAYSKNMRRVGGNALPQSFLGQLTESIPDRIVVFTAVVDGVEVGRYVFLLDHENDVLHHWLSAIPDEENFNYYPSELLHTSAIKWGLDRDFSEYNLGITASHFASTIFQFKDKYGGRAVPLLRWEQGRSAVLWPIYKRARMRYLTQ